MKITLHTSIAALGAAMMLLGSCSKSKDSGTIDLGNGTDTGKSKYVLSYFQMVLAERHRVTSSVLMISKVERSVSRTMG